MAIKSLRGFDPLGMGLQQLFEGLGSLSKPVQRKDNLDPLKILDLLSKQEDRAIKKREQQFKEMEREKKALKEAKSEEAMDAVLEHSSLQPWQKEAYKNSDPKERARLLESWTKKKNWFERAFGAVDQSPLAPAKGQKFNAEQQSQIIESLKEQGASDEQIAQILSQSEDDSFSFKRAATGAIPEILGGLYAVGSRLNPITAAIQGYDLASGLTNVGSSVLGGPEQLLPRVEDIQSKLGNIGSQLADTGRSAILNQDPAALQEFANNPITPISQLLSGLLGQGISKLPLTGSAVAETTRKALEGSGVDTTPRNIREEKIQDFAGLAAALSDPKKLAEEGIKGAAKAFLPGIKRAGKAVGAGWLARNFTGSKTADAVFTNGALLASHFKPEGLTEYKNALYKKAKDAINSREVQNVPLKVVQEDIGKLENKLKVGDTASPRKQFINDRINGIRDAMRPTKGGIKDLVDLREELNTESIRKSAQKVGAKGELKEAKNIIDKALDWWKDKYNGKEIVDTYREANSINTALNDKKLLTTQINSWLRKPSGLHGIPLKLASKLFVEKAQAAERMINYPSIRNYYLKGWKAAADKDMGAFAKTIRQLDSSLKQEDKELYNELTR